MATRYDIELVNNPNTGIDDFVLGSDTDLILAPSDTQHIKDTINASKGWYKQFPSDGVGIGLYLKAKPNITAITNNAQSQLSLDGYTCINPIISISTATNTLVVQPNATR